MLLVEDSIRERVARITIEHRDGTLQDDRPAVELERHDMNGHAAYLDPMLNCLVLCVHPGKCRQQRRMNIEDRVWKSLEELGTDEPHVTGQVYQSNASCLESLHNRGIVFIA